MSEVNIHSHTVLPRIKISGKAFDCQMAWVRGYILALDDLLKDLEQMKISTIYPVFHVKEKVTGTLEQAHATLTTLEQMEKDSTKE